MIVADSSFIAEGVLTDEALLRGERMLAPELAVYETASAIWKHQVILGVIDDGPSYLDVLNDLLRSNTLLAVSPDSDLLRTAYDLAVRYRAHPHDTVFVALAVRTGLRLETFDSGQLKIFEKEKGKG